MANPVRTIACAGLAAGAVYYFDPLLGKRRRSLLRDQWNRLTTRAVRAADVVCRDSTNRFQGLLAEMRSALLGRYADEETLAARVRSKLGRLVSHPSAVEVAVQDGNVILSGPVLASEVDRLIEGIRSMPEVPYVKSQLEVHEEAGNISALQGAGRRDNGSVQWQAQNLSPTMQAAAGVATAGIAATLLMTLGPRRSLPLAMGGVLAVQTFKLWNGECREAAERKSGRFHSSDGTRRRGSSSDSRSQQRDLSDGPRGAGSSDQSTAGNAPTAGASLGGSRDTVIHDV
jgi:hypothetical protein